MMFHKLRYYNLDTKKFVDGENKLMEKLNDALAHVRSFQQEDGSYIICNSVANYTEKRARDAIDETIGINTLD
jgi:hypothetical protein